MQLHFKKSRMVKGLASLAVILGLSTILCLPSHAANRYNSSQTGTTYDVSSCPSDSSSQRVSNLPTYFRRQCAMLAIQQAFINKLLATGKVLKDHEYEVDGYRYLARLIEIKNGDKVRYEFMLGRMSGGAVNIWLIFPEEVMGPPNDVVLCDAGDRGQISLDIPGLDDSQNFSKSKYTKKGNLTAFCPDNRAHGRVDKPGDEFVAPPKRVASAGNRYKSSSYDGFGPGIQLNSAGQIALQGEPRALEQKSTRQEVNEISDSVVLESPQTSERNLTASDTDSFKPSFRNDLSHTVNANQNRVEVDSAPVSNEIQYNYGN